ncbi:MAG: hypothetical protein M0P47_09235 [Bacteroidales bacterium]|jgi:hypothetical protein|nr:hypothetical protein [Bacteroidales bacterium]
MVSFKIWSDDKKVEVNIYKTQWIMHAASLRLKKRGIVTNSTHGALGICYRWYVKPYKPNRIVTSIMMSWDTLTFAVLCHELFHAAVHIWTYDKEEGKVLSCESDEPLAYIHSNLVADIMEVFTEKDFNRMKINSLPKKILNGS